MTHQLPSDKRVARALCDANGSKMVGGAATQRLRAMFAHEVVAVPHSWPVEIHLIAQPPARARWDRKHFCAASGMPSMQTSGAHGYAPAVDRNGQQIGIFADISSAARSIPSGRGSQ